MHVCTTTLERSTLSNDNRAQQLTLDTWPCTIEIAWVDLGRPDSGSFKQEILTNRRQKRRQVCRPRRSNRAWPFRETRWLPSCGPPVSQNICLSYHDMAFILGLAILQLLGGTTIQGHIFWLATGHTILSVKLKNWFRFWDFTTPLKTWYSSCT